MQTCAGDDAETPRRFCLDGREIDVVNVLDQWQGPGYQLLQSQGPRWELVPSASRSTSKQMRIDRASANGFSSFRAFESQVTEFKRAFPGSESRQTASRKSFASAGPRQSKQISPRRFRASRLMPWQFFDLAQSAKQICDGTD